jgi:hypothetical protein
MNELTVIEKDGGWWVKSGSGFFGPFATNAEAWADIDRVTKDGIEDEERRRRIDTAFA